MSIMGTLNFITYRPLSRNRKSNAIKRFVAWQVGSRLVPGPVAINFVNNARLLVSPGMTGATGNIYTGLHEFEDMAFYYIHKKPCSCSQSWCRQRGWTSAFY